MGMTAVQQWQFFFSGTRAHEKIYGKQGTHRKYGAYRNVRAFIGLRDCAGKDIWRIQE